MSSVAERSEGHVFEPGQLANPRRSAVTSRPAATQSPTIRLPGATAVPTLGSLIDSPSRNAAGGPQQLGCVSSGRAGQLPSQTAAVRARCERTAVQRGWVTFHAMAEFAAVMPILSVRVRWGRVIRRVCKPEVTGSIPVRSITRKPDC